MAASSMLRHCMSGCVLQQVKNVNEWVWLPPLLAREILLEEAQLEQQSGRRFNHAELVQKSISPIQRDPDAPSKPLRQYGGWEPASTGFSLGRVSSDSNSSRLSHSNDLQRDVSHTR